MANLNPGCLKLFMVEQVCITVLDRSTVKNTFVRTKNHSRLNSRSFPRFRDTRVCVYIFHTNLNTEHAKVKSG